MAAIVTRPWLVQKKMSEIIIKDTQGTAKYYIENLGNGIELEMVLIPEGTFMMGAPENEEGSNSSQLPQHKVTVPTFFMGRYQITQAQWRAVANFDKVNRDLTAEPSHFKGDKLPVETVSWYDAVEFCDRLSKHTGRNYHLPSEAEWEYACRAGTTTPFHFGETITTDLANYLGRDNDKWSGSYGNGPKGIDREKTTPVGSFDAANGFGLFDMHGNIWEWCFDDYHKNYKGAPTDGSAWVEANNDNHHRVIRGGSWQYFSGGCRSAFRINDFPASTDDDLGLRVACSIPSA